MLPDVPTTPYSLSPSIVLVTPDASCAHIHEQLISVEKSDKVHPINGLDDLLNHRLGDGNSSKRCFALMKGNEVQAAIYTYWTCPENAEKEWMVLPGQVDRILHEPAQPLPAIPGVVTFYSISSFVNGGGKILIGELHKAFTAQANPPILTTLSPLRSLRAWIEETGREIEDTLEGLVEIAATYLGIRNDPVQKFHQGNGAYIGAIQPFANAAGSKDDVDGLGVMVNYRYPRTSEALQANQADYRSGAIPAASHIRALIEAALR